MKRNGFTLIELMIVLAIFSIIGTVLVKTFTSNDSSPQHQNDRIVEKHNSNPECRGGFLIEPDGTVVVKNQHVVKC